MIKANSNSYLLMGNTFTEENIILYYSSADYHVRTLNYGIYTYTQTSNNNSTG